MPTSSTSAQKLNYICSNCIMSWIILCVNCIFSLYAFPLTHSENDDECDNELTTDSWILNIPPFFALLNSFSTSILFNNFASSSCLHLCSLFYTSFSFTIRCSFSIAFFALILLWIPNFEHVHNFQQQTQTVFNGYSIFSPPWTSHPSHSFFHLPIIF